MPLAARIRGWTWRLLSTRKLDTIVAFGRDLIESEAYCSRVFARRSMDRLFWESTGGRVTISP